MTPEEQELILQYIKEEMNNHTIMKNYNPKIGPLRARTLSGPYIGYSIGPVGNWDNDVWLSFYHKGHIKWKIGVWFETKLVMYWEDEYGFDVVCREPFDPCDEKSMIKVVDNMVFEIKRMTNSIGEFKR